MAFSGRKQTSYDGKERNSADTGDCVGEGTFIEVEVDGFLLSDNLSNGSCTPLELFALLLFTGLFSN